MEAAGAERWAEAGWAEARAVEGARVEAACSRLEVQARVVGRAAAAWAGERAMAARAAAARERESLGAVATVVPEAAAAAEAAG